jgi:hypothetical protein
LNTSYLKEKGYLTDCVDLSGCYVRVIGQVHDANQQQRIVTAKTNQLQLEDFVPLTTYNKIPFDTNVNIQITNLQQIASNIVQFIVQTNVTSPSLFLELTNTNHAAEVYKLAGVYQENAGWFSQNNFLAEANTAYTVQYIGYQQEISVTTLAARLQARVLQHSMTCDVPYGKVSTA